MFELYANIEFDFYFCVNSLNALCIFLGSGFPYLKYYKFPIKCASICAHSPVLERVFNRVNVEQLNFKWIHIRLHFQR